MTEFKAFYKTLFMSLAVFSAAALAQDTLPQNAELSWKTMHTAIIGGSESMDVYDDVTPQERQFVKDIWGDTIDKFPINDFTHTPYVAMVNIAIFDSGKYRYVFSNLSAAAPAYPKCEYHGRGTGYTNCPMRVNIVNRETGNATQQDFPDYCHIIAGNRDKSKSENFQQIALNLDTHMAYYRLKRRGQFVNECNRSLQLPQ